MMRLALALAGVLAACSDDPPEPEPQVAAFPADYAGSYSEVRDCRKSGDHDLSFVRVLADPAALAPYETRNEPFPDGAVLLKEEYDFSDSSCAGEIVRWTVMIKASAATDRLGWDWQSVDARRNVVEENGERCQSCHTACRGGSVVGYDYTCTEP